VGMGQFPTQTHARPYFRGERDGVKGGMKTRDLIAGICGLLVSANSSLCVLSYKVSAALGHVT